MLHGKSRKNDRFYSFAMAGFVSTSESKQLANSPTFATKEMCFDYTDPNQTRPGLFVNTDCYEQMENAGTQYQ